MIEFLKWPYFFSSSLWTTANYCPPSQCLTVIYGVWPNLLEKISVLAKNKCMQILEIISLYSTVTVIFILKNLGYYSRTIQGTVILVHFPIIAITTISTTIITLFLWLSTRCQTLLYMLNVCYLLKPCEADITLILQWRNHSHHA